MAATDSPSRRKSIFDQLKPSKRKKRKPVEEEADEKLDQALSRLARSFNENEGAAREVRRRQSSGRLKIAAAQTRG